MSLFSRKPDKPDGNEWFLPEDSHDHLRALFAKMDEPVEVELFAAKGENEEYTEFCRKFLRDLARLSNDKLTWTEHALSESRAEEAGVERAPTLLVAPDRYHLRFTGAPAGEEGRSFIEAIFLAGRGDSGLQKVSRELLAELDEQRRVTVFASPTCPYCPGQVMHGVRAAVERPEYVRFEFVEIAENRDLAQRHDVGSVPHTLYGDSLSTLGLEPEERFVVQLVTGRSADEWLDEHGHEHHHDHAHDHAPPRAQVDLVVMGAGPAGLTAAIYAERSGLRTVILDKANVGGQVALTPVVENYPGFTSLPGGQLVEVLAEHARRYTDIHEFEEVTDIRIGRAIEVETPQAVYLARGLIIATGATWKKLGVPGENTFYGQGVSHCASCDAQLFKGKKVAVVGGGNTALTDALYLKNIGAEVVVVHRRDAFRAEKHLQDSLEQEGIEVVWNHLVTEILGDARVSGVRLASALDGTETELPVDGVFVAIGEKANTALVEAVGVVVNDYGDVVVDRQMRTNIPRVFAAGDVTGGVRQIVTAVGEGAVAATTAFADLERLAAKAKENK